MPPIGVRLLGTGVFHGDEVQARSGERCLALYAAEGESALIEEVLTVRRVRDEIVDEDTDHRTGKEISVKGQAEPLFLLLGAHGLRAGPVTTLFAGEESLTNKSEVELKLKGAEYLLKVVTKDKGDSTAIESNDARLVLSAGASSQVLYDLRGRQPSDAFWSLLWAGDLDGDGKLDLYVNVTWHYNVSQRKLFLSAHARRGKLVREVAQLRTTGC